VKSPFLPLALVAFLAAAPVSTVRADSPSDWRGFNLLGLFNGDNSPGKYEESDFAWIRHTDGTDSGFRSPLRLATEKKIPRRLVAQRRAGTGTACTYQKRRKVETQFTLSAFLQCAMSPSQASHSPKGAPLEYQGTFFRMRSISSIVEAFSDSERTLPTLEMLRSSPRSSHHRRSLPVWRRNHTRPASSRLSSFRRVSTPQQLRRGRG
jgi:hypothetical protein